MTRKLYSMMPKKHYGLMTFLLALLMASVMIVPFIIYGGGIFWYYGDFNAQEIPFYQMLHSSVKSGNLGWSYLTDLGSDTISSYSFYLIGSPFFWLTIPFPNEFVPYLIGPLLIIKIACSALSAYIYLRRYVRYGVNAALGGLIYAFSGFSIYNIFFFHFHEAMIILPLMLAALDAFLYEKKRGIFALTVFAACAINYYFFAGQAVFILIYFLMLALTKTWKFKIKEFLILAVEVAVGFAGAAFIVVPTAIQVLANPRINDFRDGWNAILYKEPQRYIAQLAAFFFPSDMPAYPIFTPDLKSKWSSIAAWLPLFGMTGVIAYLQMRRRDWLKKLLVLLFAMACVPIFNSAFQMFNTSIHYSRWFYMLTLMMILATLRACEATEDKVNWPRAMTWSAGFTLGIILVLGLMTNFHDKDDTRRLKVGVLGDNVKGWVYAILALSSLIVLALIYKKYFHRSRHRFFLASLAAVIAVSVPVSMISVGAGVFISNTSEIYSKYVLNSRDKIAVSDLEEVRIDSFDTVDNLGMYWKVPSINCFQSTVSGSIMEFYNSVGITRSVGTRPEFQSYGLRPFLSVKYYFDYTLDDGDPESPKNFRDKEGKTKMPGWKYLKTCNKFDIYENENYIPMGFCFKNFITNSEFNRIEKNHRTEALLYALTLSRSDMKKYADITGYSDEKYEKLYGSKPESFKSIVDDYSYGNKRYSAACKELAAHSCESFRYTNTGFEAKYNNTGDDSIMLFTVPYSSGFTAEINGKPTEIINADHGMMAVRVPGHRENNIVFTYKTPGLKIGVIISLCALLGFAAYIAATVIAKRRKKHN